jgi:hypothetical protein
MAFALRPALDADPRGKRFTGLALALVLAMLAGAAGRPWFAYIGGGVDELNHPVAQLAQALREAGYDGQGRIIAADHMLAGALRTRFPGAPTVYCREWGDSVADCVAGNVQTAERAGQGWLIISRADWVDSVWWGQALSRIAGSDRLPRGNLRLPFRMVRPDHAPASYDFVWHPAR